MEQNAALYMKLIEHYKKNPISLHVPGHKMGNIFHSLHINTFEEIMKIDMTEITGLDDLHHPEGVILEAEQRAASIFGADKTFFLVNGSTSGNLAMVFSLCQPGDKIIVQSNVHKSVINAILLARAKPIYITPEFIDEVGIAGSISYELLNNTLQHHSDSKAVFLMNPNYYGVGINLEEVSKLVHTYGIPLLVDEAHGAHYGFHPAFPSSALEMGADMIVQSTHKTLSAMTMGSMLHIKSKLIDIAKVKMFLSIFQTSSPSYPIMASLDLTCSLLESKGKDLWEELLNSMDEFREKVSKFKNLTINLQLDNRYLLDPLKIIIYSRKRSISGFTIQKELEKRNVYIELADYYNALAVITLGSKSNDLSILYKALEDLEHILEKGGIVEKVENYKGYSFLGYSNQDNESQIENILYKKSNLISLDDAIGKRAFEMVIPYPPGIPIIHYGDKITTEAITYIQSLITKGAKVYGIYDLTRIKVLES